jgi:hypothetical protein
MVDREVACGLFHQPGRIRRRFEFKRLVCSYWNNKKLAQKLEDEINAYPELLKFRELL